MPIETTYLKLGKTLLSDEDPLGLNEIDLPPDLFEDDCDVTDLDRNHTKHGLNLKTIAFQAFVFVQSRQISEITGPMYKTYGHRLTVDDKPKTRKKDKRLTVVCKKCKKRFAPTYTQVNVRLRAIEGKMSPGAEGNFYCSDKCKGACPLYRFKPDSLSYKTSPIDRDQGYLQQVNKMALERAEHRCEICGRTDTLKVHHIKPFKTDPYFGYDIDNMIVLCHEHHMEFGHPVDDDNCSMGNLKFLGSKTCFKEATPACM